MPGQDLDTLAPERPLELAAEVGVHGGKEGPGHLHDRHPCAEAGVDVGELHPDSPAADDRDRRRELPPGERLPARQHDGAVDLETRERPLGAAGRQEDVARRETFRLATRRRDQHAPGRQPTGGLDVRDLVFLEEELDALRLAIRDLTAAVDHAAEVGPDVVRQDAALGTELQLGEEHRVAENRLGGDAAPVAADAAGLVTLDHGGPEPELRGTDGGHVAARPGAQDDEVVLGHEVRARSEDERERLLEERLQLAQESTGEHPVDDPVVAGERDRHRPAGDDVPVPHHRRLADRADGEDGRLRRIDDRGELRHREHPEIRDGERPARQVVASEAPGPGPLDQSPGLPDDRGQWLPIAVVQHGHHQAVVHRGGHADVHRVVQHDRVAVVGGVHLRHAGEGETDSLQDEVREGDDPATLGLETGTLPGGRYAQVRLQGDPPAVYGLIAPTFKRLAARSDHDPSRPGIEFYRRHDIIDLLLPVR